MKQSFSIVQFLFVLLVSSFQTGYAQYHEIRLMKGSVYTAKPTLTSEKLEAGPPPLNNVINFFSQPNWSQVCAYGMWALYNTTNFGQGFETTTNVMTIRGFDAQSCASTTTYPAIGKVQSIHWLGNTQREMPGLFIFSEPNFLGTRFSAPTGGSGTAPTADTVTRLAATAGDMDSIKLGSLAITGPGMWRLCSDVDCLSAICIDVTRYRGTLYMNRNVITDTSASWPAYVRAYVLNPKDTSVCISDGSPPVPVVAKSLNGRKSQLEIF